MKLSVIIPIYNEEKTIALVLEKVLSVALPQGLEREVIVVNDGSLDRTEDVLDSCPRRREIKLLKQAHQGKTAALALGIAEASGDIILIQDADLEYDPGQYPELLGPVLSGEADVVYGSRFLGNIKDMRWINNWANRISNWTLRLLYRADLTDINTCYKVFKRQVIREVPIRSRNFAFETEVTVKLIRKGVRIREVPIEYTARSHREGKKIRWLTALEMYWQIIKYRFLPFSSCVK